MNVKGMSDERLRDTLRMRKVEVAELMLQIERYKRTLMRWEDEIEQMERELNERVS